MPSVSERHSQQFRAASRPNAADVVLTTLNARYAHCAFGLRYLMANLGELQSRARILEFDISQRALDVAESILWHDPKIVGLGVYVWNAAESAELAACLKRLRPDVTLVIGGPEVSYEVEQQEIARLADYVITGEADLAFAELCQNLLGRDAVPGAHKPSDGGDAVPPAQKIIAAEPPAFDKLTLPYHLYTNEDIAHRVVYVETSRGCPFECEFCLSALDIPLRAAPMESFLAEMQKLLDRGLRHFKFVDRTFNLDVKAAEAILDFFLQRHKPGLFLHFEMIPDRFPEPLRELVRRFPPGSLQFEVGVQTFNEAVAARISRRQDNAKAEENLRWLREQTGVHIHADLIVGLPGEDLESFASGFDRLVSLRPHEIQVGILKRLRGAPIARHDTEWQMVYSPHPPYEILQNKLIDFFTMQRLRRFARYWDLVANSGNFIETAPLIWRDGSAFAGFMQFNNWLYSKAGSTHGIALARLAELLFIYLTDELGREKKFVTEKVSADFQRSGRKELPHLLRGRVSTRKRTASTRRTAPRRQARHTGSAQDV